MEEVWALVIAVSGDPLYKSKTKYEQVNHTTLMQFKLGDFIPFFMSQFG